MSPSFPEKSFSFSRATFDDMLGRLIALSVLLHSARTGYVVDYKDGDHIELYVNKVSPYFNIHETYPYYTLPVCRPAEIMFKPLGLGEILDGDRLAESLYEIKFKTPVLEPKLICTKTLSGDDIGQWERAIEKHYFYEFGIEDISFQGYFGFLNEEGFFPTHTHKIYLYKNQHFTFFVNDKNIISVNISNTDKDAVDISSVTSIDFTYTVSWKEVDHPASHREKFKPNSLGHYPKRMDVHWLSIINSFFLVLLLVIFIFAIISQMLNKDLQRYNSSFDDADSEGLAAELKTMSDYGWKVISGDVFRPPAHVSLFSSIIGVGSQFLLIFCCVLFLLMNEALDAHQHGSISAAIVVLYAITSLAGGYVSGTWFKKLGGGAKWIRNVNLTAFLFVGPGFVVWAIMNTVSWAYQSTQALPATTVILLSLLFCFVGYPLTIMGAVLAKNTATPLGAPCRTKNIPREIPPKPWFKQSLSQAFVGGLLPFTSVLVELYYIFQSLWGHDLYTLYGILALSFVILLVTTACMSVALTYYQLIAEEYRWWWFSVFNLGSAGLFVFGYSIYFYMARTEMSGFFSTVVYFGWSFLACYAFGLTLAAVSFFTSMSFVRYIYSNLKAD